MTRLASLLFLLFLLQPLAAWSTPPTLTGKVLWIYDGDTIKVERVGKVRLIGIDTPERKNSVRDNHYLRLGIEQSRLRQVADDALQYLIRTAKNRRVALQLDRETHDRHGRLLAYVYLPDGQLLNQLLIEKGFAAVYRKFDFQLKTDFLQAEEAARRDRVGLWQ